MLLLALIVAAPIYPDYTGYVVDRARGLDQGAVEKLRATASRLDHAGIAQLAVVTVTRDMLNDTSREEYAADLFKKWGLGHGKKKADGLLILIVPGPEGHRGTKVEVGYGLEGLLPDGKLGALYDQYARPYIKKNAYGDAAANLANAIAAVLEADAAAGGEAAPGKDTIRGGKGIGQPGAAAETNAGGLVVTILCMLALVVMLATSGARRQFPGKKTQLAGAGLTGLSVISLIAASSGAGWIALVIGLIVNTVIWVSIRAHKCPKDGSWMTIEEEVIDPPTYWSEGVAHVTQRCTNRKCGYKKEYDKSIPRKQMTVVTTGGGGGSTGGSSDGFSGGGGGDSGGGGVSRED
jgi:uncharacterized membrane protein YgcG